MDYLSQALFICDENSEHLSEQIVTNNYDTHVNTIELQCFLADPLEYLLFYAGPETFFYPVKK